MNILKNTKAIMYLWILSSLLVLFYSYTQIDLNLTISSIGVWQSTQKFFQYIGYFNRPLSTYLYCAILLLLFILYKYTLKRIHEKKLTIKTFWSIIFIISGILLFSYNAFSYDFFNYIFDAKIVTYYHENPYLHKALDYPSDPMLNFMRWTHRLYPYGPIWLLVTVPVSFIGSQLFVITYFLFKLLIISAYLGTIYFLWKITQSEGKRNLLVPAFFALNPLVLIEVLVSGHNDIVMMFFAILALYLLTHKKKIMAFIVFLLSIGTKFATVFALPFFIASYIKHKRIQTDYIRYGYVLSMLVAILAAVIRAEGIYQPWYFLFTLPFIALIVEDKRFSYPAVLFSFISLLNYIPFLYTGNWDPPIPQMLQNLNLYGALASLFLGLILAGWEKRKAFKV